MTLRIGLIGCGAIANAHVNGWLEQQSRATVTAVCDVDRMRAEMRAGQLGSTGIFTDYQALLNDSDVDAVDICLPHHLHRDAVVAAAAAGKQILCEKPLCLSLEEAAEITAAVQRSGVMLMCAHNQVFLPTLQAAKLLIEDGYLGRLYMIRTHDCFRNFVGRRVPKRRAPPISLGWRASRETMGGGELIDTGYHPSYLLLYLAESQPAAVTAMVARHRITQLETEDTAHVLVQFEDGAIGNVLTSWAFGMSAVTPIFHVIGDKGECYGTETTLHFRPNDFTAANTREFARVNTYTQEIAHFTDCLVNGEEPLQTERDGVATLRLILAAYQSAEQGRRVDLPPQ